MRDDRAHHVLTAAEAAAAHVQPFELAAADHVCGPGTVVVEGAATFDALFRREARLEAADADLHIFPAVLGLSDDVGLRLVQERVRQLHGARSALVLRRLPQQARTLAKVVHFVYQPAVKRVRIGRRNLFDNFQQLQVGQSDFLLPGPPPRRFRRAIEQRAAVCLHQFVGCPCGSVVRGSFGKGIAGRCQPTRNFVLRFFGGSALHARTFLGSCHELWRSGD